MVTHNENKSDPASHMMYDTVSSLCDSHESQCCLLISFESNADSVEYKPHLHQGADSSELDKQCKDSITESFIFNTLSSSANTHR